jgi:superfamily II DNA helicase RecQ
VVKKSKKCVADMAKSIAERFVERRGNRRRVHCGIVYCLSRKQCEDIAGQLEVRRLSCGADGSCLYCTLGAFESGPQSHEREWDRTSNTGTAPPTKA